MLTVFGIRQCDTCRRALRWLAGAGIEHRFHDLRADGLDPERVGAWLDSAFADTLINRRSATWRQLTATQRSASGAVQLQLLLDHPTLIKRPVFALDGAVIAVGFDPDRLTALRLDRGDGR